MIILSQKLGEIVGTVQNIVIDAIVDAQSDLPAVNDLSPYRIVSPSTCYVIADGSKWMLNSGDLWVQQPSGVSLDLSGYYTSAQVDSAISTALSGYATSVEVTADIAAAMSDAYTFSNSPSTISNGEDVLMLQPGVYAKATNVNTLVNMPSDFTGNYDAFILFMRLAFAGNSWRRQAIIYPTSNSGSWATRLCYRNNETSTAGTWGSWVRFDGGTVL